MGGQILPRIGITMGDPAGVGSEIILKAFADPAVRGVCSPFILGDYGLLERMARLLKLGTPLVSVDSPQEGMKDGKLPVIALSNLKDVPQGKVSKKAGQASGLYIERGVALALEGKIDALVTAPINKTSFNLGGFKYPGHTEFLAKLTGTKDFAMMLMGERLRVVLVTTHCPISEVPSRLNLEEVLRIIRLADRSLRQYLRIERPRIALASLNPHAGEGGLFGKEEALILLPAAEAARKDDIDITDPMPSDTLFYKAVKSGAYDVVICPYHDQGLIPLKMLHFDDGVNVTLGLPIIRTSPDHGTAFDIAGKGVASPESMKAAIRTAVAMVKAGGEEMIKGAH